MDTAKQRAEPLAWMAHASCREEEHELFFPFHRTRIAYGFAQDVCRRCPVSTPCLRRALEIEWGQSAPMRHGVWGGMTPNGRFVLERKIKEANQHRKEGEP